MSDAVFGQARFVREGDMTVARMSRVLEDSPRNVWSALTEPSKLVEWLAPGEIELRQGGAAKLNFADSGVVVDSTVTAVEPGRLLEYSWSSPGQPLRPVRYELTPEGDGVRLDVTLRVPSGEDAGRSCAGWDAHLDMLAASLAGVPIKFPFELFKAAREAYRERLGP